MSLERRSCDEGHIVNEPPVWDVKASFLVSPGLESGEAGFVARFLPWGT